MKFRKKIIFFLLLAFFVIRLPGLCPAEEWEDFKERLDESTWKKLKKPGEKQRIPVSYSQFWLFYEDFQFFKYRLWAIRPFFSYEEEYRSPRQIESQKKEKAFDWWRIAIIPPLLDIYRTPLIKNFSSFQIFDYTIRYHYDDFNKSTDKDFAIYPIVWYGSGEKEADRYFAIFPIWGTIKGKLGMDYIDFILFPIYTSYGYYRTKYHAYSIFWPFFLLGKGYNRYEFRLWPFFSYSRQNRNFERWRVLWPIISYEKNFLASIAPQQVLFILPLYGYKTRFESDSYSLFWPFFSWGRDAQTGTSEYNILWPFIQIADSRNPYLKKRFFFPFYGQYDFREKRSRYISPLYFEMKNWGSLYASRQSYLIPMFWISQRFKPVHEDSAQMSEYSFYVKFWPFFHYYKDLEKGSYQFNLLSPLWFRHDSSVETIYSPFWSLVSYKRMEARNLSPAEKEIFFYMGDKYAKGTEKNAYFEYFSLLFRLYSQWEYLDTFQWQIPLLANYTSREGKGTRFQFLLGFFEYNSLAEEQDGKKEDAKTDKNNKDEKNQKVGDKKSFIRLFWFIKI